MSELHRMAQAILDEPLVAAPTVAELDARNRRRRTRGRRSIAGGTATLAVALSLVLALVVVPTTTGPLPGTGTSSLASFIRQGVAVPDSTLSAVGLPAGVTSPSIAGGQLPTTAGKPTVVFVGAEYCPYCALERWALVVALSRFGTFSHLGQVISSSSTDVFPGLQSWSFDGSSFSSPSLSFEPAEQYSSTPDGTGGYRPLQRLSTLQQQAVAAEDPEEAIPFVDIGGRYVTLGASASPDVLEGRSLDQIAADLADPSSPVAVAVDGTANYLVAAICAVTGVDAAPVCSSSMVATAQARMANRPFDPQAP